MSQVKKTEAMDGGGLADVGGAGAVGRRGSVTPRRPLCGGAGCRAVRVAAPRVNLPWQRATAMQKIGHDLRICGHGMPGVGLVTG